MSSDSVNLAINGVAGRMGRQLLAAIGERSDAALAAAVDAPGQACIGVDCSVLSGSGASGIVVQDNVAKLLHTFDTIIDFSAPPATLALLELLASAAKSNQQTKRIVIGTTGFTGDQLNTMQAMSVHVPIVFAPNYSIGVTLTLSLLQQAASALGDDYDVEVIEAHHRHKVDAPSGTALAMGHVVADALGRNFKDCAVYGRQGITGERERDVIGFETIRAGDIIGEHTVLFAGNGERVEITHRATDRMTFARGAIRAAIWLNDQPPGLYDMRHVLELV